MEVWWKKNESTSLKSEQSRNLNCSPEYLNKLLQKGVLKAIILHDFLWIIEMLSARYFYFGVWERWCSTIVTFQTTTLGIVITFSLKEDGMNLLKKIFCNSERSNALNPCALVPPSHLLPACHLSHDISVEFQHCDAEKRLSHTNNIMALF